MSLRRAYMAMHRRAQQHFSTLGATVEQYVALSCLDEQDGITQRELADVMGSDANTITAMARLLEQKGLLMRKRHQDDGRALRLHLTAKGRRLQRQLMDSADAMHDLLENAVGAANRQAFIDRLAKVDEAFRGTP